MKKLFTVTTAAAAILALSAITAHAANPVSATLSATYFEVADGTDADFPGGFPVVADGSSLGPNGLPIVTSGISDVDSNSEITWWSPALNSHVAQTGTGTITLPYASNMFAPNSTGSNDSSFFETAVFKGNFDLSAPSTVEFELGSDDDSFIYVDGTLIGQNPGIHGITNVNFTSGLLPAGPNSIEVFYADRENVAAALTLNLLSTGVTITAGTPEPATWAMMLVGVGMIGAGLRTSRRRNPAATTV
jgi:hypothetical protein